MTDQLSADLDRLEQIVNALEREDLDLDGALALFEEGIGRLRAAKERLAEAEAKVERVLTDAAGVLKLTRFDA